MPNFDLQGHRGARGLKPENTLPSFETAFDLGVSSVETDVHLTRDGVPVIYHDHDISERICQAREGANVPDPRSRPLLAALTLEQIQSYRALFNPDRARFPTQDATITPLADDFARRRSIDPYAPPALSDLLAFAQAYVGDEGRAAGKTDAQRQCAGALDFHLELKRVPFYPEYIGDRFDGDSLGLLEQTVLEISERAGMLERIVVRSFDHRCLRVLKQAVPRLKTAVLVAGTRPLESERLVHATGAAIYCPEYLFLDKSQVDQLHTAGVRVIPWTVNDLSAMQRLLDWGVDGITTDYPHRLRQVLQERGAPISD